MTACTVSGNSGGSGGGGPGGQGGGIFASSAILDNCLVAQNTTPGSSPDVAGAFTSQGHNLIGQTDGSTGFTNGLNGDLTGNATTPLDPKLGSLANDGGPTTTMALLAGSPAIDAGDDALLGPPLNLTTDQRGFARKSGAHVDIGAYELQVATWTQTSAPGTNWSSVACSADGTKIVAVAFNGPICTSTNFGTNWTVTSAPITNWQCVAASADGNRLVAVANSGGIYTSPDGGDSWTAAGPLGTNWYAAASSGDGSVLLVAAGGYPGFPVYGGAPGPVLLSTNAGATWIDTGLPIQPWTSVSCSADGTRLLAAPFGPGSAGGMPKLFVSTNSGALWIAIDSPSFYLSLAALSGDGTRLLALVFDVVHACLSGAGCVAQTYISSNLGISWQNGSDLGPGPMILAASADGAEWIAGPPGYGGGQLSVSVDFGITWIATTSPVTNWSGVAASADGSKLVATVGGGGVYTWQTTPAPSLSLSALGPNVRLSWTVPSASFMLQQNSDLTTTNWTYVTNMPVLNLTNLQNQILLSAPGRQRFYRLNH